MFFCFNRVLKLAREARVARTGVLEEEVDILNDPRFLTARNTASHVIQKAALETTRPTSIGSKHVYLSMAELKAVLTLPEFLPHSPNGLFRFNQRVSKNYQVDLMNCKNMDRWPVVDLYEIDTPSVYKAFKLFFDKHLAVGDGEDLNKQSFFLACNDCLNMTDNWYCRGARIGEHKISEVVKLVAAKTGFSLSAKDIRHSAITTMSVCNTPMEDCMELIGHKRVENMEQTNFGKHQSILYGAMRLVEMTINRLKIVSSNNKILQQPSPREEIHEQELNHHQVLDVIEEQQGGHDKQHETVHETVPEPVPEHGK
ncbi:hypothetical protein SELMODRAFT_428622 [Selaginella moellendorffii]|uniref:Uncharacterized protein n=1 Tax=Selaginella moellendorffii TaxID=88036 RepID=D8T3G2_SELML|nr:hypothetical protein SELMODRAFT_428622 [Selaginella moellendorffii]